MTSQPHVKTFNRYKARAQLSLLDASLVVRFIRPGEMGNGAEVTLGELRRTSTIVTDPVSPGDPPGIEEITEAIGYTLDIRRPFYLRQVFSGNGSAFLMPLEVPLTAADEITVTYADGAFSVISGSSGAIGTAYPGKLFSAAGFRLGIPVRQYADGDQFVITVAEAEEEFTESSLSELVTAVNTQSELIELSVIVDETLQADDIVFATFTPAAVTATVDVINPTDSTYGFATTLLGGVGEPLNPARITTGPIPLIHINYSEHRGQVGVITNPNVILRWDGNAWSPND